MNGKVLQDDATAHPFILCHHSHAGTVHFVRGTVAFPQYFRCPVGHLDIADDHMLHIVQKHGRGHIALVHMGGGIQRCAIVLIPDALSVGGNQGKVSLLSFRGIGTDFNGLFLRSTVFDMKKLPCKNRISGQQHLIAWVQGQSVYRKKAGKGGIHGQPVVGVTPGFLIDIICPV